MGRNISQKYGAATFVAGAVVLAVAAGLRYGLLESGVLPRECEGLAEPACAFKWMLVQSFVDQRLGWLALACGAAGFVLRHRPLAWIGWLAGLAGLVLYSFDYAAVGAMLSLLVLARAPQSRTGQGQSDQHPSDGLRIGRLH